MKNLNLLTQGRKGGKQSPIRNVGYILASYDRSKISVDNYSGHGDTYKQREEPHIFIEHEGKTLFEGTMQELKAKLNN